MWFASILLSWLMIAVIHKNQSLKLIKKHKSIDGEKKRTHYDNKIAIKKRFFPFLLSSISINAKCCLWSKFETGFLVSLSQWNASTKLMQLNWNWFFLTIFSIFNYKVTSERVEQHLSLTRTIMFSLKMHFKFNSTWRKVVISINKIRE